MGIFRFSKDFWTLVAAPHLKIHLYLLVSLHAADHNIWYRENVGSL